LVKHALILFPVHLLKWLFNFSPRNRFYWKCWVWLVAGEVLELYHRVIVRSSQEQDTSPRIETAGGA